MCLCVYVFLGIIWILKAYYAIIKKDDLLHKCKGTFLKIPTVQLPLIKLLVGASMDLVLSCLGGSLHPHPPTKMKRPMKGRSNYAIMCTLHGSYPIKEQFSLQSELKAWLMSTTFLKGNLVLVS